MSEVSERYTKQSLDTSSDAAAIGLFLTFDPGSDA